MTGYPLSSYKGEKVDVSVGNVSFSKDSFTVVAGPCSVETEEQILKTAETVSMLGASILRGGTYKYRKSPYTFSGLGDKGVEYLKKASIKASLPTVTEVMSIDKVSYLSKNVDMLQIGSRNMHNTPLLKEIGKTKVPVILKRGYMATIEETLLAAEHIAKEGNQNIVLCERGIRCFDDSLRFTLDLAGAILLKENSKFPVIIDPSHATGKSNLVKPLCLAASAAGLNGVMVEVHPEPRKALSDSEQSLTFDEFADLMDSLSIFTKNKNKITRSVGD
ncbi:3-deoxy-7-phosphoheptulonate synthase [bacterium]|nr:3-deoxy-7-phosphoheptulonate synthase [bacterium]|tara:strand:- start:2610 stop:3437 length:828 start_codon:yes stop_codon:yes gene_type:complete